MYYLMALEVRGPKGVSLANIRVSPGVHFFWEPLEEKLASFWRLSTVP